MGDTPWKGRERPSPGGGGESSRDLRYRGGQMHFLCVGAVTKQNQWLRPPSPCFQTRLHVWTGHPLQQKKTKNTKIWNMWRCTSRRFSRNLHWTQVLPTYDGNVVTVAEESHDTSKPKGFYHYNPRCAASSECQILRPVFFCFLWTCKRSVYWSLLPKVFPRFYPNIPFWKLLFWDFTKKERAGEARGILLPSQDALLDGFFDHLQGGGKKWKNEPHTRFYVLCIHKVERFNPSPPPSLPSTSVELP